MDLAKSIDIWSNAIPEPSPLRAIYHATLSDQPVLKYLIKSTFSLLHYHIFYAMDSNSSRYGQWSNVTIWRPRNNFTVFKS